MVRRPDAGRRLGRGRRPHLGARPRSACGVRGPATSSAASPVTTSATRASASAPARTSRSSRWRSSPPASRTSVSSAGSSTSRSSTAPSCGRCCTRPGEEHGAVPVGIGVYGTTGRLEKGYRAYGFELDSERTIVEAGMQRPKVKVADFVGREAYVKQREEDPKTVMCTLQVEDHTSASGVKRYMLGGEPILTKDGRPAGRRARAPPVRHHRRLRPLAGQAPADGLPAARRGRGGQRALRVLHGGALPGHRRVRRLDRASSTPTTPVSGAETMADILVCIKRVPDVSGEVLLTDDGLHVDARHVGYTVSPHELCAVELAVQVARRHRRRGDGAQHRHRRLGREAPRRGRRRRAAARSWSRSSTPTRGVRATSPRSSPRSSRPRPPPAPGSTWSCWATTPPTPATSRSACGWPTSSTGPSSSAPRC